MNATLVQKASKLIPNTSVLINLVSRRVRQLNAGGGRDSRALVSDTGNLSAADIALTELIEGKMGFDIPDFIPLTRMNGKGKHRPKGWTTT
jgi:DNA-directed RNA polymerase subunit omega